MNKVIAAVGGFMVGAGAGLALVGGWIHMDRRERLSALLVALVGLAIAVMAVVAVE